MATVITDQYGNMERRGAPALGNMPRLLEVDITLGGVTDAANDAVQCFLFDARTLIMNAGFEVIVPTTNVITASLGVGGGTSGATQFLDESATDATAGTSYSGGQGAANVLIAAADYMDCEVSADAGAAGKLRVWAVVMDVEDIDGS